MSGRRLTVQLDARHAEALDEVIRATGRSQSEIIRQMIRLEAEKLPRRCAKCGEVVE